MTDKNRGRKAKTRPSIARRQKKPKESEPSRKIRFKTFHTVQDRADRQRLAGGGIPWPIGLPRAVLGAGFYCWSTRRQAVKYRRLLQDTGARDIEIIRYVIRLADLDALHCLDLFGWSDEKIEEWMEIHSEYTLTPPASPHGVDHIVRETGNVGKEHFFSPRAFRLFREIKPPKPRGSISLSASLRR
jgi:hypothetical protein